MTSVSGMYTRLRKEPREEKPWNIRKLHPMLLADLYLGTRTKTTILTGCLPRMRNAAVRGELSVDSFRVEKRGKKIK